MQIPKAQKYSQGNSFFALLGSARVKASSKMLVKLTPGNDFRRRSLNLGNWRIGIYCIYLQKTERQTEIERKEKKNINVGI